MKTLSYEDYIKDISLDMNQSKKEFQYQEEPKITLNFNSVSNKLMSDFRWEQALYGYAAR